jgi:hypothetical protein
MRDNKSSTSRGLRSNEHFNKGNGRVLVDAPKGYPGKKYIGDRYAYRYQVNEWKQSGKVADPKKEVVHHLDEPHDTHHFPRSSDEDVAIESRHLHYGKGHGAPFSKRRASRRI